MHNCQHWNRKANVVLCVLVILGLLAALPIGAVRWKMEKTSDNVQMVFDYRDLVQIAAYKSHPKQFLKEELPKMKDAGITAMAVFESSLQELSWAGRLSLYNSTTAFELQGKPHTVDENYTYVLFADKADENAIRPVLEDTFKRWGIVTSPWSFEGHGGLILETPLEDAILKPMVPDPIALNELHAAGFTIVPRLSDRVPFDAASVDEMLGSFQEMGVSRILFEGDAVKGFADNAELKSLSQFAELLNKHGIGIAAIENSKPQKGMGSLGYLTDYNVVRLYSLSDNDSASMKPEEIADRFQLAAKDRSIRMFYLNGSPSSSPVKSAITDPLENLYNAMQDKNGVLAKLDKLGFEVGQPQPFKYESPSWVKPLKGIVVLGAVAFITLLISAFVSGVGIPVFVLGLVGSAGLYVLSKPILEQALALGASISAPTLALIWAIRRVRAHTVGNRRPIGGAADQPRLSADQVRWFFPGLSAGRRLLMAITIFASTAIISMSGIPFIVGLLNNMTYKLVLEQFRGVSLLHLAPIALVALYLFLYTGESVIGNLRRLLNMQITVLWVAVAGVLGVMALYYLSRTGNAGQVSSVELVFRNVLESTFGVRPRTKEFLLSHPLFFFGIFVALRYRAAWVLFIVGSIGQLSMVDTFAHIHTPLPISLIRDLLGLVLGALIGLAMIGVWQIGEGVWKRWAPRVAQLKQGYKSGV